MKEKDYHKHPTITIRIDQDEKQRLEGYSEKHGVSIGWILKRALKLFWDAVKKGEIKP